MKSIIKRLQSQLSKKTLSLDAQKRISKDLDAIYARLLKNEYETSGIVENAFDVPDKSKQFHTHLKTYARIGRSWIKVLRCLPINNYPEIVDICPGYAPKVELGLLYSHYKGRVIVLDVDASATKTLTKFMELFDHEFSIQSLVRDLFSRDKRQFNFVIGNHVVDDLILNYFAVKEGVSMSDLYEKEGEFVKMWGKILENEKDNSEEISKKLTEVFDSLIQHNGYLCLSQYKSYMEKMLDLHRSYLFSKKVFGRLIAALCHKGFDRVSLPKESTSGRSHFSNNEVVILRKLSCPKN